MMSGAPTLADSSSPQPASYQGRHLVLPDGVAYGWTGRSPPARMRARASQAGVSRYAHFAFLDDSRLINWGEANDSPTSSIPLLPRSTSKHFLSATLGSTVWQAPRFAAMWSLGSNGLNEVRSATRSRWATASPSFASISGPDGACTSRSVAASLLSCWLADPSGHRRAISGERRR